MRVKTFTAASMAKAMQMVRAELGDEAVILSSESGRTGVRLVAALETSDSDLDAEGLTDRVETEDMPAPADDNGVRAALIWHGMPEALAERLHRAVAAMPDSDPATALAAALDRTMTFQPLAERSMSRPLMLVGPPGVGKTLTAAKLIVDAHRRGQSVVAASCDIRRAGGIEQLQAFTRILGLPLARIEAAEALRGMAAAATDSVVVIDTAGVCSFNRAEMDELEHLIEAGDAEPILVLAAGCDAVEASETAIAFARRGCRRLIATRLDVTRRLGTLLAAAATGRLAFAGAGISPEAADPPAAISPLSLARLLLSTAPRPVQVSSSRKAPK